MVHAMHTEAAYRESGTSVASVISRQTAERLASTFRVLADATRLRIVSALVEDELSVGDLADAVGMSLSAVSHQLRLLREHQIVKSRRDGRHIYYSLDDEHVVAMYRYTLDHVCHGAPAEAAARQEERSVDG